MTQNREDNTDIITIHSLDKAINVVHLKGIMAEKVVFEKNQNANDSYRTQLIITKEDIMLFQGNLVVEVQYSTGEIETVVKDNIIIDNTPPRIWHNVPQFIKDTWSGELTIEDTTLSQGESFVSQYQLIVNGKVIEQKLNTQTGQLKIPLTINANDNTINHIVVEESDMWHIQCVVVDNYGNKDCIDVSKVIHDKASPIVEKLILLNERERIEANASQSNLQTLFTNENVTLIANIVDTQTKSAKSSGEDSAIIVLHDDLTQQQLYYANDMWHVLRDESEAFEQGKVKIVNQQIEKTLTFPKNVKGVIYVIAKDKVGNKSSVNIPLKIGIVFESKNGNSGHDKITMLLNQQPNAISDDIPLYKDTPLATIKVVESFVPLSQLQWRIIQDNKIIATDTIDIEDTFSTQQKYNNLSITHQNNAMIVTLKNIALLGQGGALFQVKTKNKAGNTQMYNYTYVVDNIAPKINVIAPLNDGYFNQSVVIDVEIVDDYINTDTISFIGTFQDNLKRESWQRTNNGIKGKVVIHNEGRHEWGIVVSDRLGNQTMYTGAPFIIDKSKPVILTSVTNQKIQQFYNQPMTYNITMFDEYLLNSVDVVIFKDKEIFARVSQSNLQKRYEEHFQLDKDGEYRVEISGVDVSGNNQYFENEFILDTKIDEFNQVGILDNQFYKRGPQVVFRGQDKHMVFKGVAIYYLEPNGEHKKIWEQKEESNSPIIYHLNEHLSVDGYYVIKSSIVDKAGNQQYSQQTILFSKGGISFEPSRLLKVLINKKFLDDTKITDDLQLSLSSWIPFKQVKLFLIKDTKLLPIHYTDKKIKEVFQKEYHHLTLSKQIFQDDGEYELWVVASNVANDKLTGEKILHIKKDTTPPKVMVMPMIDTNRIYFEISDQFGIQNIELFVNDQLVTHQRELGKTFYASQLQVDKSKLPSVIKWVVSDIYGNKTQHEYVVEEKKSTVIEQRNLPLKKEIYIKAEQHYPIWEIITCLLLGHIIVFWYLRYKKNYDKN